MKLTRFTFDGARDFDARRALSTRLSDDKMRSYDEPDEDDEEEEEDEEDDWDDEFDDQEEEWDEDFEEDDRWLDEDENNIFEPAPGCVYCIHYNI